MMMMMTFVTDGHYVAFNDIECVYVLSLFW